jgi:colanic acid biosynthesis glycosyl transferase WcaI
MKILLLNQTFYPDVMATSHFLTDFAEALAARGHQVTVVTGRRAYDNPDKLFSARERWRGIQIFRVYSTWFGKGARWHRSIDFASFIFCSCFRLLFLPRHDVVVALTTPPLISFIGAWRAKLWHAKFCYWVMDMNPDEAIAAGWLRADSLIGIIMERMSRFSFHRAERIIALDRFMSERIAAKGIAPDKIVVIPPWSHDDKVFFTQAGREKFRKEHGFNDKFVVMYAGNHSPVHPMETLMQAAEQLQTNSSIVFCFMGGGVEFKRVQRWAQAGKFTNVLFLPYVPLSEMSTPLSAADAQVVIMGEAMLGLVHPCKIYNIMAAGAAVIYIGPEPSHVTEILADLKPRHPWVSVQHGMVVKLVDQIHQLYRECTAHNHMAPTAVELFFSKAVLLPRLVALVESTVLHP